MAGKLIGASIGAKLSGSPPKESLAVAVCMNSRGAMEILLANVALASGVINNQMFVALVFMAIITSLLPGPVLRFLLRRKQRQTFTVFVPNPHGFMPNLEVDNSEDALKNLCKVIGHAEVTEMVIQQEQREPSGNHDQLALVRTHVPHLSHVTIGIGLSSAGIDFSGQGGYAGDHPHFSNIIVLCLFPESSKDPTLENDVLQQISLAFSRQAFRNQFLKAKSYLEIQSLTKYELHHLGLDSTQEEIGANHSVSPGIPRPQTGDEKDHAQPDTTTFTTSVKQSSRGSVGGDSQVKPTKHDQAGNNEQMSIV